MKTNKKTLKLLGCGALLLASPIIAAVIYFGVVVFGSTLWPYLSFDYKGAEKTASTVPLYSGSEFLVQEKGRWPDGLVGLYVKYTNSSPYSNIVDFYEGEAKSQLLSKGWVLEKEMETPTDQETYLRFTKDGWRISIHIGNEGETARIVILVQKGTHN